MKRLSTLFLVLLLLSGCNTVPESVTTVPESAVTTTEETAITISAMVASTDTDETTSADTDTAEIITSVSETAGAETTASEAVTTTVSEIAGAETVASEAVTTSVSEYDSSNVFYDPPVFTSPNPKTIAEAADMDYIKAINNVLHGSLAFDDNYIYYKNINDNGNLYRKTYEEQGAGVKLADANKYGFLHHICVYNGYLYYVTKYYDGTEVDGTDGGEPPKAYAIQLSDIPESTENGELVLSGALIENDIGDNFYVAEGKVLYSTDPMSGSGALYIRDMGSDEPVYIDGHAEYASLTNGEVTYSNGTNLRIYDTESSTFTLDIPLPKNGIQAMIRYKDNVIYNYRNSAGTGIGCINITTQKVKTIHEAEENEYVPPALNIFDNELYFYVYGDFKDGNVPVGGAASDGLLISGYYNKALRKYNFEDDRAEYVMAYSTRTVPYDRGLSGCALYSTEYGLYEYDSDDNNDNRGDIVPVYYIVTL